MTRGHFLDALAQVKPSVVPMMSGEVGFPAKGRLLGDEASGGAGAGRQGPGYGAWGTRPWAVGSRRAAARGAADKPSAELALVKGRSAAPRRGVRPVSTWRREE